MNRTFIVCFQKFKYFHYCQFKHYERPIKSCTEVEVIFKIFENYQMRPTLNTGW